MLKQYLKNSFNQAVVCRSVLNKKNWVVESGYVKKQYTFDTFSSGAEFKQLIDDYLSNKRMNFSVNNVYNGVTIQINGELNDRDIQAIKEIDNIYSVYPHSFDYYLNYPLEEIAKPDRLAPKNNIQHIPTNYKLKPLDFIEDKNLLL
jgi:pterin-4a-carbinolamine dehydratase